MVTRADVVQEARSYLETRWVHMGRNRRGIDCAGLVVAVAKKLELSTYDFTGYTRESFDHTFLTHFRANMQMKPLADARPGDVVAFFDAQYPCHVGMIAERDGLLSLVHAYARRRKVVEELYGAEWQAAAVECYEFHGLED